VEWIYLRKTNLLKYSIVKKNQINSREDKILSYWSRSQIFVLIDYVGKNTILKNLYPNQYQHSNPHIGYVHSSSQGN